MPAGVKRFFDKTLSLLLGKPAFKNHFQHPSQTAKPRDMNNTTDILQNISVDPRSGGIAIPNPVVCGTRKRSGFDYVASTTPSSWSGCFWLFSERKKNAAEWKKTTQK